MQAKDRIILALDVDSEAEALGFVRELTPYVGAFKVGMQLFNSSGPSIVSKINDLGGRVFVDLKFHDIPNTVAAAGRVMTRLNCYMFNVHAAGGRAMLESVAGSVQDEAERLGSQAPILLAVTVLTSIGQQELEEEMFISGSKIEEVVVKWALMAKNAGINGVVCSPREIEAIRAACGSDFKIVTPGIRPAWSEKNDQVRVTTPADALRMGADYMVIGRPILKAADPIEAAQMIIEEMEAL
ncbi:orotidine-5'-phosphate decarboxylase [Syntrophomonas curvata]